MTWEEVLERRSSVIRRTAITKGPSPRTSEYADQVTRISLAPSKPLLASCCPGSKAATRSNNVFLLRVSAGRRHDTNPVPVVSHTPHVLLLACVWTVCETDGICARRSQRVFLFDAVACCSQYANLVAGKGGSPNEAKNSGVDAEGASVWVAPCGSECVFVMRGL